MRRILLAAVLSGAIVAQSPKPGIPNLAQLKRMTARFAPVDMGADTSALSLGDRQALPRLIEAANVIDDIFLTQRWSGNHALLERLRQDHTPLGKARLRYFVLNKGPWSDLDGGAAFLPGVPPHALPGANFYPADMRRQEFDSWVKTLPPAQRAEAEGFFTIVRRDSHGHLTMVPYSEAYKHDLERAAALLREAAAATGNQTLRRFLTLRAGAFLSNDYYASDIAWMDLAAPLDLTIGPYETYNDEIFGYKAAFEAYITLRDEPETAKLRFFAGHMQEVENNLPLLPRYRNPHLAALAPISVVNEIRAAGDAAHGVRAAAFNLPNDERVVHEKGSKRVMLKNIQEAKFNTILLPISRRMLGRPAASDVSFDAFFTHILAHEMSHGIGPHQIEVAGRSTTPRQELKELYGAIEEAKADVTGLFLLQFLYDNGLMPAAEKPLYTTFLASAFRTLRFGLKEAHGKGMALQFNYLADKGAFIAHPGGTWAVDFTRIKSAVRDLDHELLTIEATGDYSGAKRMLDTLGILRPDLEKALASLAAIPTDIAPAESR